MDYPDPPSGHLLRYLGEFVNRPLFRIPEVHRTLPRGVHEAPNPFNHVVDVAIGPGLLAVTEDGQRLTSEDRTEKVRDGTTVVEAHSRPMGIEDPRDLDDHPMLMVVGHREGLRKPLSFVVDAPRPDRIHVAPI